MEAPPTVVPPRPAPPRRPLDRIRSWTTWFGVPRLVASGAAIVLVAVAAWWLLHAPRPSTESQLPYASVPATATTAARSGSPSGSGPSSTLVDAVVHVAGAVAHPGVYHVPAGARVVDAIASAGGLTATADTDGVNLAAPVRDGSRIYVPAAGEVVPVVVAGADPPGTAAPAGPVDLNAATVEQLDTLPGVGPTTAASIVAYRDEHGPFASVDDLGEVRGIGPAKLDALRGLVTV